MKSHGFLRAVGLFNSVSQRSKCDCPKTRPRVISYLLGYLLGSLCGTQGRLGLLPRYMYDTRAGLLTSGSPGEIGMQAGDITLPSHHHRHHLPSRIRMSLVRANFLVQHEPWGDWDAPPAAFIPLQTGGGGSYLLGLHWQASGRVESLSSHHRSVCL